MARVYKRDSKGRFGSGGGSSAPKAKDVSGAKTKTLQERGQKNIADKARSSHTKAADAWTKAAAAEQKARSSTAATKAADKAIAATNAAYKASQNLPKDHPARTKAAEMLGQAQKIISRSGPTFVSGAQEMAKLHSNAAGKIK